MTARPFLEFIVVATFLFIIGSADAESPRTRKLDYDSRKKEWVELPPPPPGSVARDLYDIQMLIKGGSYTRAVSAANKFIKRYGDQDPLHPDVLVAKADALVGKREFDHAYKVLQEFMNRYAGVVLTEEALRLQFVVAEGYLGGTKRKIWGIFPVSGVDRAYEILDEISTGHAESGLAELAVKTKADHMFRTGEHDLSELEYGRMLREYPRSRYQQFAMRRSADAALASFAGVEYDEAALIEAEERYNDYRVRYSAAANREGVGLILENIRERRADKDYSIGAYYERTDHLSSAVFYYRSVCKDFSDTVAAGRARARLELLGEPLSEESGEK